MAIPSSSSDYCCDRHNALCQPKFQFLHDAAPVAWFYERALCPRGHAPFRVKTVPELIAHFEADQGNGRLCLGWQRLGSAHCRRDVQDDDRHRNGPRALSRRRSRLDRSDGPPGGVLRGTNHRRSMACGYVQHAPIGRTYLMRWVTGDCRMAHGTCRLFLVTAANLPWIENIGQFGSAEFAPLYRARRALPK
jgi:hypothetical protein